MAISTINQNGLNAPLSLTAPNLGTPSAINLTNATALPSAALPTGSVLQVVNATYATQASSSSSTFADTGLTATITPKFSTSKILVLINQSGLYKSAANTANAIDLRLVRGSTSLITFISNALVTGTTITNNVASGSTCYLDSPATTSATTYKTQFASTGNSATVYVQQNGDTSTITLLEIAG